MNIFITGGAGFIGKNLVSRLSSEGHTIYLLLRKRNKFENISDPHIIPWQGDINDPDSYRHVFENNIDIVYHLAAIPGKKWNISEQEYYKTNARSTEKLLEMCHGKIKRFIFSSSINAKIISFKEDYGISKRLAERAVIEYAKKGLDTVIVRPVIVYGPDDIHGMMLKLSRLIKNKRFFVVGSGSYPLPLVYIDDLTRFFSKSKEAGFVSNGKIIEISHPEIKTVIEIAKEIADLTGVRLPRIRIPVALARPAAFLFETFSKFFTLIPPLTLHQVDMLTRSPIPDLDYFNKNPEYTPKINFKEGIILTINWYKKNGYIK